MLMGLQVQIWSQSLVSAKDSAKTWNEPVYTFAVASAADDPVRGKTERLAESGLRGCSVDERTTTSRRHSVVGRRRGSQRRSELCRLPTISSERL